MKIITIFIACLLTFSTFSFGQGLTPKQKEILEEIRKKDEAEKALRKAIEERLGLNTPKESKSDIPKDILQNRDLSKYLDGGYASCGNVSGPYKCNFEKLREFIWNSWSQKKLSYFSWGYCGRDFCYTEYNFIEPNKKDEWRIVRYGQHSQDRKADKLPEIYSIEWAENKDEKKLLLKNKLGKVIDEY